MSVFINRRIPLWALAVLIASAVLFVVLVLRRPPAPDAIVPTAPQASLPSPTPNPTATARATSTPVPSPEPTSAATPSPEPPSTPTVSPAVTPTDTHTPSPTPAPTPTATPTPIGGHQAATVTGIAFATESDEALAVLSGNPPNPPHFRPGERIFAAVQLEAATPGSLISRFWYRNGEQVGVGETVVSDSTGAILGNVGQRWGMPGGNYELVVWDGDRLIGSATFTVDVEEVRLTRVAFTRQVDELGLPLETMHSFPIGTQSVLVSIQAFNVPTGAVFEIERVVNGALKPVQIFDWPAEYSSGQDAFQIAVFDVTLPDRPVDPGDYRFRLKFDGKELIADIIKIEGAGNS